jgi:GNAT superfamily N-acetyltransferase
MGSAPIVQNAGIGSIQIEPVTDKRGVLELIEFPFKLYRGDRNWVPPLIEERRDFLDPNKNPFFEHARFQLFLARRDGDLVGTIGAVVDDNHNQVHDERMGAFGFFESIDNQEVAGALLGAAEDWVRAQGMTIMRGPMNFSTNHEVGLLIEGDDESPMVMMTYNPRYYARLIEARGYVKAMDLFAYIGDLDDRLHNGPPKLYRAAEKAAKNAGIRVRKADMRHFAEEVKRARSIYDRAWTRHWGFVPLTEKEGDFLAAGLKPVIDPDLVLIAETLDGAPIGMSITLPDLHQALKRSGGGHMLPFGLLKFLWHKRKVDQVRLWGMGVIEEYRGRGIDALFYIETARAALAKGYKRIEGSWILESNTMMNRIIERLGGRRYKTYRIYEKSLDRLDML